MRRKKKSLQFIVVLAVLLVMVISGILSIAIWFFLYLIGAINNVPNLFFLMPPVIITTAIIIGFPIAACITNFLLKPLRELIKAMQTVTEGDYSVRVTERRRNSDIGLLLSSFNIMADELSGTEIFRNDFINNFSHEFKTPIVSIRGFAKRLKKSTLTESQRAEYLDFIISEAERLSNMSTNILLLSRYENLQIISEQTSYHLDEQIRKCVLLFEKQWDKKNIEISLNLPEIPYRNNADMLSHVWINIISNAIKYTDDSGIISITGGIKDDFVIIDISDNGIGMDQETLNHIFDKFYQGDTSHATKGNGLGLALVHRIVDLCDGEILVESEVGAGTTFRINLPYIHPEN